MSNDTSKFISTGLRGRCPNCHEGRIFEGYLKFAGNCASCGFDLRSNDVADGPAVFVILIASILIVPLALAFQIKLDAPFWLTLIIWVPAIILVCLALLRPFRGLMFSLQVMNNASEAQLDTEDQSNGD